MKYFITFAAVLAVAVAVPTGHVLPVLAGAASIIHEVEQVPAVPVIVPEPVVVGPAIIDEIVPEPIAVGPEIVDSAIVNPTPAGVGPGKPPGPLVQLIVNVNGAPLPIPVPGQDKPEPIIVVDEAENNEEIKPEPVIVVDPVIPEPVIVVDPVIVEPVIIGSPIIPAPAVILPEELN